MKIINKQPGAFLQNLVKSYTEGVYADTPANRKLGRVGMTYAQYADKLKGELEKPKLDDFEENIINDDNQIKLSYKDKEGKGVGEIVITKEPEDKILYLDHINVYGDYQGKGIGKQILKKALQICNKEGDKFNKIELWVDNAKNQFTKDEEEQKKNNKYLADWYKSEGFEYKTEQDKNDLNPTMVKNIKKSFTVEQIKDKITSELNSLKKKNDYVIISTNEGHTIRFSRNFDNSNKFGKVLVKDSEDKVIKSFENTSEEALLNSVSSYIQKLGVDIVRGEEGGSEEISIEDNTKILTSKMKEAKDKNLGTIILKGSGDKIIYLNRQRNGRWLKDFEAYTIRDSKRNILSQGKAESESELLDKLNNYFQKNKIKLEI